jgi:hypothetical protein
MNGTMTDDDSDAYAQLIFIILMGLVLLCGCCFGSYVCYKETQNTKRWSDWVKAKKRGDPTVLV